MSPMGRRMSPGRRISPSARKASPSGPKHIMMEHRLSPGDRRAPRRVSPARRRDSPPPGPPRADDRYSPSRRHPDKPEKYSVPDLRAGSSKHIRPAYDLTEAQKQDVYSGGYRPSAQSAPYPAAGARQPEPLNLPWQHDRDNSMYAAQMNKDGDRREAPRMDITRANEQRMPMEQLHSARKSRSPIRDRYKRHSPSPRSPRRSWALEKRRSPDVREAPPPPMWPGRAPRDDDTYVKPPRAGYDDRLEKGDAIKAPAVWDEPLRRAAPVHLDDERRFTGEAPGRMHRREPSYEPQETRFVPPPQREPKFTRENFTMLEQRTDELRRRDDAYDRKPVFEEPAPRDMPRQFERDPEAGRPGHFPPRSEERREPFTKLRSSLDKEIEDVHKRALEFSRKTEEFKRDKKYDGDSRGDMDRLESKHYEQRHKLYREEEPRADFRLELERRSRHEGRSEPIKPRGDPKWDLEDDSGPRTVSLSSNAIAKREKAIEELTDKIIKKHDFRADSVTQRRVTEELKKALTRKVREIFGDRDTSFIEIVIKFNARYDDRAQEKIFDEVLSSFPSHTRSLKRMAQASPPEVPAKRRSPGINPHQDFMQKLNNQQRLKQGTLRARAVPKPSAPVKRLATKQYVDQVAKVDRTGPPSAKKSRSSEEVDKKNITSVQKLTAEAKVVKTPASQAQAPGAGALERGGRAPEVHCELNALMSRMLNAELQDIMIRVWQQLPDKPLTEAEGLVVDKLRNEIGDDLRNVIGLDVTKRLLNIHNPLLVKITFSTRPDIASLKKFFKYHNITNFQIADTTNNTFMAQLRSIKDFDNLCSHTKLRCGGAQVTITSCYNFTKCPVKIKTNFVDNTETKKSKAETTANNEQNLKKEEKDIKTPIKKEINEKTLLTSEPVAKNEKVDLKSNISQEKSDNVNVTAVSKLNKNNEYDDKVKPTDSKTNSPLAKEPEKNKCNPKVNAVTNNIDCPVKVETKLDVASKPTTAPGKDIKGNNVTIDTKPVEKSMSKIEKTADVKLDTKTAASSAEKSGDAKSNVMTVASSIQESVSAKADANAASSTETSVDAKSNVMTVASSTHKSDSAKPNANAASNAEKSVDAKSNVTTVASSTQKTVSAKLNATNTTSSAEKSIDAKPNIKTVASSAQKNVSGKPSTNNSNVQKTLEAKANTKNVSIAQKSVDDKCETKNVPSNVNRALKQSKSSDKKNLDEYEEMNDEEILQLLSGGIVLDEC